jgi:hypothetical protein
MGKEIPQALSDVMKASCRTSHRSDDVPSICFLQIREEGKKRINMLEGPDGPVTEKKRHAQSCNKLLQRSLQKRG